MVRFTVTIERPNGTRMTREFKCPRERRIWVKDIHSLFPKGTRVVEYHDDVYVDDEEDLPPTDEAHWYDSKKGGNS